MVINASQDARKLSRKLLDLGPMGLDNHKSRSDRARLDARLLGARRGHRKTAVHILRHIELGQLHPRPPASRFPLLGSLPGSCRGKRSSFLRGAGVVKCSARGVVPVHKETASTARRRPLGMGYVRW
jgi:hypothetical protein